GARGDRRRIAAPNARHPRVVGGRRHPRVRGALSLDALLARRSVDGTKEFTVNIALIEDGAPTMGVVFAPVLDLMYWARSGAGTWREGAGAGPERVYSAERTATAGRIVVQSRSHPSAELEAYLATIRVEQRISLGSSLKFCWVADGRADMYPRFGPTMEWDVAAGDCVYRESARNGRRQTPFTYNKRDIRNGSFVLGA